MNYKRLQQKRGVRASTHLAERVQLSRPVQNPRAGGAPEGEVEGVKERAERAGAASCQPGLCQVEEAS